MSQGPLRSHSSGCASTETFFLQITHHRSLYHQGFKSTTEQSGAKIVFLDLIYMQLKNYIYKIFIGSSMNQVLWESTTQMGQVMTSDKRSGAQSYDAIVL